LDFLLCSVLCSCDALASGTHVAAVTVEVDAIEYVYSWAFVVPSALFLWADSRPPLRESSSYDGDSLRIIK
jgi:hypothetical protein